MFEKLIVFESPFQNDVTTRAETNIYLQKKDKNTRTRIDVF